jgi:hypothetical protein
MLAAFAKQSMLPVFFYWRRIIFTGMPLICGAQWILVMVIMVACLSGSRHQYCWPNPQSSNWQRGLLGHATNICCLPHACVYARRLKNPIPQFPIRSAPPADVQLLHAATAPFLPCPIPVLPPRCRGQISSMQPPSPNHVCFIVDLPPCLCPPRHRPIFIHIAASIDRWAFPSSSIFQCRINC